MKADLNCISCLFTKGLKIILATLLIGVLFSPNLFSQAPTVTLFSPTSAAKGTTVTITGTNFTGATAVSFGGIAATSFTVNSSTQIVAVVPLALSGSIVVTNAALSGSRPGFIFISVLSGIVTDFAGYWSTTTASNSLTHPDDSHNLLAFTYNDTTYSTGINNSLLTARGINFKPGNFRALPVANISGVNPASGVYLAMGIKVDGNASVANAAALAGTTIRNVMTDGLQGLNMGTGVTNLPASANLAFELRLTQPGKINDSEPDIIITQIADPTTANDTFKFVTAAGATVGTVITQNMQLLTALGTYDLDLFNLTPGASFNSAVCFSPFTGSGATRQIRMVGFKLSEFGITAANYAQVTSLKINPSSTSDYAFVAYSDALDMYPNIAPNLDKTISAVCAGGTAHLEVITAAAYGGSLSYSWEQSVDGGTTWSLITNGANYSGANTGRLTVASTTFNYKYRATVIESGSGYSNTSSAFTISAISPAPTAPSAVSITASASTTCLNTPVSFSATVTGGTNLYYQWQTNASGSYFDIPNAIANSYVPPVNTSGVISYKMKVSGGSGCTPITSSATSITVVGISSVTSAARCGAGSVSVGATATSGTLSWYAASIGGSALNTGPTYSPSISATVIYYVTTNATGCGTIARIPVTATINSITWAGTIDTAWSRLANWDCGSTPPSQIPDSNINVTIPSFPTGNRFPTISTIASIRDITISTGASITVDSNGVFEIHGIITNNGRFTDTSGTITMQGATQQTIPANAFYTNTINNLTINNTAGVFIGGPLNITGTYKPTAGILTTFGNLTLKSNANGTARVAPGTGTYITGNVNVERYIPERRSWRLMTVPLTTSNTIYQSWQNNGLYEAGKGLLVTAPGGGIGIDASGNASLKKWSIAAQALQTINNTKVPISAGSSGSADNTGYFVFIRGDRLMTNIDPTIVRKNTTTLTSTGLLQTGTQNFTGLSSIANGVSLIGNPYASPVDMNLVFANAGTTNLQRKFYVWDPRLNAQQGGYVAMDDLITPGTFSPNVSFSSQNNYIQSSQALFVLTNLAAPANVEFRETNKGVTNNTAIFGRPLGGTASFIADLYLLNPNDSSTVAADGTRADFNDAFSADIDGYDNLKFTNVNETFGIIRNNVFLATERRPSITGTDTLFLRLLRSSQRSYQLQFKAINFIDPSITAVLDDSFTGSRVPLSLSGISKVNFVINSDVGSQAPGRFRMVFSQATPLPVTFTSVNAYLQKKLVAVEWKVESEINITHYEVERSADGRSFAKMNSTLAKGNNQSAPAYTWKDAQPLAGTNFYRIKSIDLNSSTKYSEVVKVNKAADNGYVLVYPNPVVNKTIFLQLVSFPQGIYSVVLSNSSGQQVLSKKIVHNGSGATQSLTMPASAPSGTYQADVTGEDGYKTTLKVIVQ